LIKNWAVTKYGLMDYFIRSNSWPMEMVCLPLPFPLKTFLKLLKEIHNLCLSQIVQSMGSIMHAKIFLLHRVDALTTYFAWLHIWRANPLFMLVSLVGNLCPQISFQLQDSNNSTWCWSIPSWRRLVQILQSMPNMKCSPKNT
jgi:hypothetical protein